MQITINFFEIYVSVGLMTSTAVFFAFMLGLTSSIYNWSDLYISGERTGSRVDGLKLLGTQFYIWRDVMISDSREITPGMVIWSIFIYLIVGTVIAISIGMTWLISIPIKIFFVVIENKRSKNLANTQG